LTDASLELMAACLGIRLERSEERLQQDQDLAEFLKKRRHCAVVLPKTSARPRSSAGTQPARCPRTGRFGSRAPSRVTPRR
jgi:hypothetical protein